MSILTHGPGVAKKLNQVSNSAKTYTWDLELSCLPSHFQEAYCGGHSDFLLEQEFLKLVCSRVAWMVVKSPGYCASPP